MSERTSVFIQKAAVAAVACCCLGATQACKRSPDHQASVVSPTALPVIAPKPTEWSKGPDLSSLPNEGQDQRRSTVRDSLQPMGASAFLEPAGDTHVMGMAHFQDTVTGMRVTVAVQGLAPGTYALRADEFFYGPLEGDSCAESQKTDVNGQPVVWLFGPLEAGKDGVARLDRLYEGIGNDGGPYSVPALPVYSKKGAFVTIKQKQFSLSGRKLTLHKWAADAQPELGPPISCAIVHSDRTFGEATFKPFPGQRINGTAYFEQGEDNRALLELELSELTVGKHRLVVHEFADCDNVTATGVGEPYQPEKAELVTEPNYGWPLKQGDLGTFTAGEQGTLNERKIFRHPLTSGSPHIIRGRAIVVERLANDASQKATRIGCGMVTGF
ncbi:MAG: superoxide dismutase family protein [Myxococcales bacterium]|nr:superoxide dismutase family protein [Myxococcales bacterium]